MRSATNDSLMRSANSNINFKQINKYHVGVISLKNKLIAAQTFEEIMVLLGKITDLERAIMVEKMQDNDDLSKKKKVIEDKIDKARRRLKLYENELDYVSNTIEARTERYRSQYMKKINTMSYLYNE